MVSIPVSVPVTITIPITPMVTVASVIPVAVMSAAIMVIPPVATIPIVSIMMTRSAMPHRSADDEVNVKPRARRSPFVCAVFAFGPARIASAVAQVVAEVASTNLTGVAIVVIRILPGNDRYVTSAVERVATIFPIPRRPEVYSEIRAAVIAHKSNLSANRFNPAFDANTFEIAFARTGETG